MQILKFVLLLFPLCTVYSAEDTEKYSTKDGPPTDAKEEHYLPQSTDRKYTSDIQSQNDDHDYKLADNEYSSDVNSENVYQFKYPDADYNYDNKYNHDTNSQNEEYSFPDAKYTLELKEQNRDLEEQIKNLNGGSKYNIDSQHDGYQFPEQDLKQGSEIYQPIIKNPKLQPIHLNHKYPEYYLTPEMPPQQYFYPTKQPVYTPKYYTKYPKYPKRFYTTLPYGTILRTTKGYANSFPKPFYRYKFSKALGSKLIGLGSGLNRFQFTKPVVKYTNSLQFNEFNPAGPNNAYNAMTSDLKSPSLNLYKSPQSSRNQIYKTGQSVNNNEYSGVGSGSSSVVSGSSDSGYSSPVSAGYTFGTTGHSQTAPEASSTSTVEYASPSVKYSFNTETSVPSGFKYSSHASPLTAGHSFYKHKEYPVVRETGYTSSGPGYKYSSHGHTPLITEYGTSSTGGYPSPSSSGYKFNINGHPHSTRVGKYSTPVSSEYITDGGFRPSPSFGYPTGSSSEYKSNHFMPISSESIPENKYLREYKPVTYNIVSGKTKVYDSNLYDVINLMKSGKFSRRNSNDDIAVYVLDKSDMANFPDLEGFPKFDNSGNSIIYRYK